MNNDEQLIWEAWKKPVKHSGEGYKKKHPAHVATGKATKKPGQEEEKEKVEEAHDDEMESDSGNPFDDEMESDSGSPFDDVYTSGHKEKGQRREGLSMLSNVERFLASDGDAESVAIVHDAIQTMYMHVAKHVERDPDDEDRYDGIDDEPSFRRETDQEKYGYSGDR